VTAILRKYYDDIVQGIASFSDDIGSSLLPIGRGLRLKRGRRYRVKNPHYEIRGNGNTLTISRYEVHVQEERWAGSEYHVSIDDISYLIPDEALNDSGEISMTEIEPWKYDPTNCFF